MNAVLDGLESGAKRATDGGISEIQRLNATSDRLEPRPRSGVVALDAFRELRHYREQLDSLEAR